jgi:hypothetical protein
MNKKTMMQKEFVFTLRVRADIDCNELTHPDFNANTLALPRQFQKEILADDDAIIDYYKLQLLTASLADETFRHLICKRLNVKDTHEIFLPVSFNISPKPAEFILTLYRELPHKVLSPEDKYRLMDLVESPFKDLQVKEISFINVTDEIERAEKRVLEPCVIHATSEERQLGSE